MKLKEILKPHSVRISENTLQKLRIVSVHCEKKQNDILDDLLTDEMKKRNINIEPRG